MASLVEINLVVLKKSKMYKVYINSQTDGPREIRDQKTSLELLAQVS